MLLGLYIVCVVGSLIVYAVILYEFLRIHTKRIVVVTNMPEKEQRTLRRGRKRMTILYSTVLLVFYVYSSYLLFG